MAENAREAKMGVFEAYELAADRVAGLKQTASTKRMFTRESWAKDRLAIKTAGKDNIADVIEEGGARKYLKGQDLKSLNGQKAHTSDDFGLSDLKAVLEGKPSTGAGVVNSGEAISVRQQGMLTKSFKNVSGDSQTSLKSSVKNNISSDSNKNSVKLLDQVKQNQKNSITESQRISESFASETGEETDVALFNKFILQQVNFNPPT